MWICPKCKREFKRTNQGHYCGNAPKTVDEYIELQQPETREHITELRNIIHSSVPELTERIAWSMPFFEKGNGSISFAVCKNHISLYLDDSIIDVVKIQLSDFVIKKNAVYLPYNKALPTEIITNAVRQCFEEK